MKKRGVYLIGFALLLAAEIAIGMFAQPGGFIRSFLGDVLVTALLCCLVRCVFPSGSGLLALWVFLFSVAVELAQLWGFVDRFGIKNELLRIIIGTSFHFGDILCYFCGCALFYAAEYFCLKKFKNKHVA